MRTHISPASTAGDDEGERPAPVLQPGKTCWRIERAERVAFLVDGEAYFAAVRAAIRSARRSIFILGWDIDSRMRLMPQGAGDGYPEPLGEFLDAIVCERRDLRAYILAWDFAMLYAFEREWLPVYQFDWKTNRRLSFRLDSQHPLGGCHHQKIVVVDDQIALLGGFDLTKCRWDTPAHECKPPLRVDAAGESYGPFHDVGAMVSGDSARAHWANSRASDGGEPPARTPRLRCQTLQPSRGRPMSPSIWTMSMSPSRAPSPSLHAPLV